MARTDLTDRTLRALKPPPAGKPYDVMDAEVKGLGVRVLGTNKNPIKGNDAPKSQMSFILVARFPGSRNPTRRAMGEYQSDLTLAEARQQARDWKKLIKQGKDPKDEAERVRREAEAQRDEEARKRRDTFQLVAEKFIEQMPTTERKRAEVARDIRRHVCSALGNRPVTEITVHDIRDLIIEKKKTAPAQARNLLGYCKRVFSWAVDSKNYGLTVSPCADIRARGVFGKKKKRKRTLSDDELFAFWRAVERMPYPYRQIYQLLALNALRLNEVADASLTEFSFKKRVWIIPETRMKGKDEDAEPHQVRLTADSLKIIGTLPNLTKGPYLFSLNGGTSPVWVGDKVKRRLDDMMLKILRAMARKRGEDPRHVVLNDFVNHDIRRTVRTNLSDLRTEHGHRLSKAAKEAVLAHKLTGIEEVYDRSDPEEDKFEALSLWADRLREIVEPAPRPAPRDNVVPISRRQR